MVASGSIAIATCSFHKTYRHLSNASNAQDTTRTSHPCSYVRISDLDQRLHTTICTNASSVQLCAHFLHHGMNQRQHTNPSCELSTGCLPLALLQSQSVCPTNLISTCTVRDPRTQQRAHPTLDPICDCLILSNVSSPHSTSVPFCSNYLRTSCTTE